MPRVNDAASRFVARALPRLFQWGARRCRRLLLIPLALLLVSLPCSTELAALERPARAETIRASLLATGSIGSRLATDPLSLRPAAAARWAARTSSTSLGPLGLLAPPLRRLKQSLGPPPMASGGVAWPLVVLLIYGPLALGLGWQLGFLPRRWRWPPWPQLLRRGAGYWLMPAFVEELLFRALLLPHPSEGVRASAMAARVALNLGLFVLYHPLAGRLWYPQGRQVFDQPAFLLECALLGLACALVYILSGSLWWPVLIHWLAVLVWLEPFQGRQLLLPPPRRPERSSAPPAVATIAAAAKGDSEASPPSSDA